MQNMTKEEIILILPIKFKNELNDKTLFNRVIEIMMTQIKSHNELNLVRLNLLNLSEFPDFMLKAFNWKSTKEGYSGWFKIVFKKDFFEERKTGGSTLDEVIAGKGISAGDIYYTNTARTFDKCLKSYGSDKKE